MRDNPESSASVGAYYDILAKDYDQIAESVDWLDRNELFRRVAEIKEPSSIHSVLDLGAGTGHTIDAILLNTNPGSILAVDASTAMLERLTEKHPMAKIETANSTIEDFTADCTSRFDMVTAISCLEFVEDLPKVMRRIARLLNRDGVLALTYIPQAEGGEEVRVLDSPYVGRSSIEHYWEPDDIQRSLTSEDLTIHHEEAFPAYRRDEEIISYSFLIATKV